MRVVDLIVTLQPDHFRLVTDRVYRQSVSSNSNLNVHFTELIVAFQSRYSLCDLPDKKPVILANLSGRVGRG